MLVLILIYFQELDDVLASNKQLATELEFDIRQFAEKELKYAKIVYFVRISYLVLTILTL